MALNQITVFVENKQGTIVDITRILADKGVDLRALSVADTQDFGILRLIVSNNELAFNALIEHGYLVKNTEVVGVKIGDAPGQLSNALNVLDEKRINLEYLYSFMLRTEKHAYVVLRVENNQAAEIALTDAGFHMITDADIQKL